MGQIAAVISDVADIREFHCLLPDDMPVGAVAARLAHLARFPSTSSDDQPISYGFVTKGGSVVPQDTTFKQIGSRRVGAMRLVPQLTIGSGEDDGDDSLPGVDWGEIEPNVVIKAEQVLTHDRGLELPLDVSVDATVHHQIEQFASRDRQAECIGLLLGSVDVEDRKRVARITALAPGLGAGESRTCVRVTLDAWAAMLGKRDRDHANLRVLGWMHTHAGWGVFMSDSDVFAHEHFFPHPNMVAYVLDPTTGHDSFFGWKDGRISYLPTYALVGTPEQIESSSRAPRRRELLAPALGVAAILAGGAYIYATRPAPPAHKPPAVKHAQRAHTAQPPKAKPQGAAASPDKLYALGRNENMWSLCQRVYGDGDLAAALGKYNGIKSNTGLQVGQTIKLPPKEILKKLRERSKPGY